jgi:hypothetical protein
MAGRGPSDRWAALLVISILLAGCGSTESRSGTAARAVHGWAATAQLTTGALVQGTVPEESLEVFHQGGVAGLAG